MIYLVNVSIYLFTMIYLVNVNIYLFTERIYERKKNDRNLEGVSTQKSEIVLLKSEVNSLLLKMKGGLFH